LPSLLGKALRSENTKATNMPREWAYRGLEESYYG
jgi:hypothetical protein